MTIRANGISMNEDKKLLKNRTGRWFAFLGAVALCRPAVGQDTEPWLTGAPAPAAGSYAPRLPVRFEANGAYQFNANVDGGGDFSLSRFRTGLSVPVPLGDHFALNTSARYELDAYDFGGGLDPWGDIHNLSASTLLLYRLNQHWAFYGGPILRVAAESGANWDEAIEGGGVAAFQYRAGPKFSFGAGMAVMSRIEKPVGVLPVLTTRWNFADDWRLAVGYTDLATAGYGVALTWDCCPHWELTLGGQHHDARFRIEGTGATTDGVGEEQAFTLGTGATWRPNRRFSASAFVELAAGGKIRIESSDGTELRDSKYDATPILGIKVNLRF
jgi:hypothetical protein